MAESCRPTTADRASAMRVCVYRFTTGLLVYCIPRICQHIRRATGRRPGIDYMILSIIDRPTDRRVVIEGSDALSDDTNGLVPVRCAKRRNCASEPWTSSGKATDGRRMISHQSRARTDVTATDGQITGTQTETSNQGRVVDDGLPD